jgi:hypothetical protein
MTPPTPRRGRRGRRALWKLLGALALTLLFAEVGVRLLGLDSELMGRSLYYQDSNAFAYEPVARGSIRYQPRTGSFHEQSPSSGHYGDLTRAFDMRFDSLHARGPERSPERRPGLFRVLFVGGSTVFGHGVHDDETLTHYLEAALTRALGPDRPVEVWNFGRQAYVLRQSVELAEEIVPVLQPDLILIHDYNRGRRPFLPGSVEAWAAEAGQSTAAWLASQPEVVLENWGVPAPLEPIHLGLMRVSALWRSLAGGARLGGGPNHSPWADERSCRAFAAARAEWHVAGQAWAVVTVPGEEPRCLVEPRRFLDLSQPGRGRDYQDCHPAPAILEEWADSLATMILERGFVPERAPSDASAPAEEPARIEPNEVEEAVPW